jgi:hypothetical protein
LLSLFKINDPYKILIILFVAVIIQLPIFISGINITLPEIEWHTVGAKLGEGGELYIDVYYPIGPLSAQVYRFLSLRAPDGYMVYRILGLFLVIIQAVIFNIGLIQYKAYNQNTYVPSLIYVVLMMGMEDYITLSPQLMGLTFILFSIGLTFRMVEGRKRGDEDFIKIGLFSGFAALFYPLYILFLIPVLIALIFFTNTIIRRYLLIVFGAFLPFFLTWLKFYWYNQLDEFYFNLDFLFLADNAEGLISWKGILGIFLIPGIFLLYSFFRVMQSPGFINYQVRLQKYYFLYVIFGIIIVILDYNQSSHILIVLVPVMAFFIAHLFLMMRKTIFAEILFVSFLSLIVFQNYNSSFSLIEGIGFMDYSSQYAGMDASQSEGKGERILVIGNDTGRYLGNDLSTPYLSWVMLEQQIEQMDNYNTVVKIFENFKNDLPEIIIDEHSVMPEILARIPELSELYTKRGNQIYNLKPKNQ